jgi:acetoacetyl-CoA synthetase
MSDRSETTSTAINMLTPIWESVLERRPIGTHDSFFDLGGDPALANQLFIEIAKKFGRELSPLTIYRAPTIAALAAVLEEPAMPRFPALVQMRAGTEGPAIFMTHGIDGDVTELFQLIKHIQSSHSIYATQAKGTDGVDAPLERVEEMGHFYLDAISKVQPRGPYVLIGYSFGGLISLELARQLNEAGEEVALLVMLDTYPHVRQLSPRERVRLPFQRLSWHVSKMMRLPFGEALSYIFWRSHRRSHFSGDRGLNETRLPPTEIMMKFPVQRLRDCNYRAWERYKPQFYGGRIRFLKAKISSYFPSNPDAVWSHLAGEFEMESVPGDHIGIVTTHVKTVAAVLSSYLEEVSNAK